MKIIICSLCFPYLGLSKRDQVIYQVPTKIFFRSILVSTMVANSETAGMADFEVIRSDKVNSEKVLFEFKKNYNHKDIRTIQAMVNMVIEAGTSIFFKWYFNPVNLAKYSPTVIKLEVLGSYLKPPGTTCYFYNHNVYKHIQAQNFENVKHIISICPACEILQTNFYLLFKI